jgi:hypothetical protein
MKIRALAVATFILAFSIAGAASAGTALQTIGVNAGVTLPTGDLSNVASTGFFGGGTYTYHLNEQWGLGGDINYHSFGKKDTGYGSFHMIQYGVHGKYFFPMKDAKMSPYAKVGFGIYSLSYDLPSQTILGYTVGGGTYTASKTGFSVGVGSTMKLNDKSSWGVEALYHMVQTEGSSSSMATVALQYNWSLGK